MELLRELILLEVKKDLEQPLTIRQEKKYKKGFSKHKHDKRVVEPLTDLITNYLVYNKEPPINFNVHKLHGTLSDYRTAHIKGQQVILVYKITEDELILSGLGSHRELGTM